MLAYNQSYDNWHHDPAMPVAEISLLASGTGEALVQVTAIVDTGADATMLPADMLKAVGARHIRTLQLRGVTGQTLAVETFVTSIQLGPYVIHGIQAVAMPAGSEAILGRDVLNDLEITLNGPAQELWIA